MKRVIKILIAVVALLMLLVVAAAILAPAFVDPNDYKPQISAAIERQLGRRVDIGGDIELSIFPWLGLELGRVEVANAKGFGDAPMATMRSAEINVKLLPLISRRIEVGMVSLNSLRLRLARDRSGRTNWADMTEHMASTEQAGPASNTRVSESKPAAIGADGESGFDLSSLQVEAVEVEDAAVSWQDAETGADYRASGVSFSTGRLADKQPVRVELDGHIAIPQQQVKFDVNLVTRVEPHIAGRFYRFSDFRLNAIASGDAVPSGRQQVNLSGQGELDMADGRFRVAPFVLQAAGLNVTGRCNGSGLKGTPVYSGRATVKEFDPQAVMAELGIEPPVTQNSDRLASAAFDATFDATNDSIHFEQILATLDDSTIKGLATIKHFARPAIGFGLHLDQLNVDDYLPPDDAKQAGTDTGGHGKTQHEAEIDLSALKALRLDGKLAAGSLALANMHLTNAKLAVKAHDGVLTIEPLTADLYRGKVRMTARVDAAQATARYMLKGNLSDLNLAPLLKDLAGTDRVAARASMNIDVTTAGDRVAAMKRALNGKFDFDLRDGAFNGFNLAKIIAAARRRIRGGEGSSIGAGVAKGEKTPFNRFAASFNVDDGVMAGQNLDFTSKIINASGTGRYDLVRNALDYRVNAEVPRDASGSLEKLAGVTVPIKLTGNLMSPNYALDVAGALESLVEQRLQREQSKLQDKLGQKLEHRGKGADDELGSRVQQGIQRLFGGDDRKRENGH